MALMPSPSKNGELEVIEDLERPKSTPPVMPLASHSTSDLPSLSHPPTAHTISHRPKIRFSIDASSLMPNAMQSLTRSPINAEAGDNHITGLRRIRQQPGPQSGQPPSHPPSAAVSRVNSMCFSQGSPIFGSVEDLSKFPIESLHSFSFASQTEDHLHSRQNIVKRGLEFMKDRLGMNTATPTLVAQAKATGDKEIQNVLALLEKANVFTEQTTPMMVGPASASAELGVGNPFDKSFAFPQDDEPENAENIQSQSSSRTGTNESTSTTGTTPPPSRKTTLKRTYTDLEIKTLKSRLDDALAAPYRASDAESTPIAIAPQLAVSPVHSHAYRGNPAAEAIFTTEGKFPWTILAANDMACLIFGITKNEVRKIGILEFVKEERREWLTQKLQSSEILPPTYQPHSHHGSPHGTTALLQNGQLTKKTVRRVQTAGIRTTRPGAKRNPNKSRGVILCGDVVPIQKRNGNIGAASVWVKEKKGGLIWVMEEISEDVAVVHFGRCTSKVAGVTGKIRAIFGEGSVRQGQLVTELLPSLPTFSNGELDMRKIDREQHYTALNHGVSIPCTVEPLKDHNGLRVSSYPHMAGIVVVTPMTLTVSSSNSVFTTALFGVSNTIGMSINDLLPDFDRILQFITEEENVPLSEGMVIPEHLFRKARATIARREKNEEVANLLFRDAGLPARHRDGHELRVDVQMRIVQSETPAYNNAIVEDSDEEEEVEVYPELMYALWITYSRNFHSASINPDPMSAVAARPETPPRQPSPGQPSPPLIASPAMEPSAASIEAQIADAIESNVSECTEQDKEMSALAAYEARKRKTINDFIILEDMGQGAYGQVKLCRYKKGSQKRVVVKYVTKKRILVDTWTRDRKLGTVPLEIHILNYLKESGLRHPNIVEMIDFFEDDINYYIEMVPHGLPGMDLFDYIELMINMDESEARMIFVQVARAVYHLHIRAGIVHRDIKDENVVLDGSGRIKLIDFGSAAFIAKGPFDVFVGTIDYAAPETLSGQPYKGKPQDIWALGVLLYTICYKENPFYNVDEIMDHEIRIPYLLSDNCLDLIRLMLDRDVERRITIEQVLAHPWFEGLPGPDEAFKLALQEEAAIKAGRSL